MFIERHGLHGGGVGHVDVHLLASVALTRADVAGLAARGPQPVLAHGRARRSLCARRPVRPVESGRARDRLPGGHGLCVLCRLLGRAGAGHLGRQEQGHELRIQSARGGPQAVGRGRLRDDREARRLGPARDPNHRALPALQRLSRRHGALVRAHRPQVVLLGAAVGRLPHAGQGRRGRNLLFPAAHAAAHNDA